MTPLTARAAQPRMSAAAIVTLSAILLVGFTAGFVVSPLLHIATVGMASLFWRSARAAQADASRASSIAPELPERLRSSVANVLRVLGEGEARRLLLLVIEQARPIYEHTSTILDHAAEDATRRDCDALIDACCGTALDLERLDRAAAVHVAATPTAERPREGADARFAAARMLFVQRMSDAQAAFAALYAAGLGAGTPNASRVGELATEIKADASARQAALAELGTLLE